MAEGNTERTSRPPRSDQRRSSPAPPSGGARRGSCWRRACPPHRNARRLTAAHLGQFGREGQVRSTGTLERDERNLEDIAQEGAFHLAVANLGRSPPPQEP